MNHYPQIQGFLLIIREFSLNNLNKLIKKNDQQNLLKANKYPIDSSKKVLNDRQSYQLKKQSLFRIEKYAFLMGSGNSLIIEE